MESKAVHYKQYRITATPKHGQKSVDWGNGTVNDHYNIVTVYNTKTKQKTRFEFWSSIAHPHFETRRDVLNAFDCFLNDAIAYNNSNGFDDFAREFGYNIEYTKDYKQAQKAYKGCKIVYEKALRVIGTEHDVIDLCNELREVV